MSITPVSADMSPESNTQSAIIRPARYTEREHSSKEQAESTQPEQSGQWLRGVAKFSVLFVGYVVALTMLGVWRGVRSVFR